MKKKMIAMLCVTAMLAVAGCGSKAAEPAAEPVAEAAPVEEAAEEEAPEAAPTEEPETPEETLTVVEGDLMIAAAASLENCLTEEIIPLFNESYPAVKVTGTYDSSGKLQTQIEEGAEVDVFFSAATKQMDALIEEQMIDAASVVNLLENKIVLIVPKGNEGDYSKFEDIANAETIAIGDPESVPAGQYAEESLTNLGLWDDVLAKSSLGTNVTEVLNWVAEGSADAGIVYATDAAQMPDKVVVIDTAPADSVKQAIYPVGITTAAVNAEPAKVFVEFLQTPEAIAIFEKNGFSAVK
ncbi:MAG: molybdate ABC transporter substrate-binding protein [bacterium]|nr:molybdate ABC transporter substrate-binding protein [bacterium]